MKIKGKVKWISAPSMTGLLKCFVSSGTVWEIKFKCGNCGAKPIVQHDEDSNYHKCPVCKTMNILDKTSWYDQ